MKIFGKDVSREEIQQKTGDISQLGGIKYYEMLDGVSRGVRGIDIKSPCGLDMTVLPDRGMDISNLSYKSIPITWRSTTRETSSAYYESSGLEWLRTFFGGLITTCGLTYMGAPDIDEGEAPAAQPCPGFVGRQQVAHRVLIGNHQAGIGSHAHAVGVLATPFDQDRRAIEIELEQRNKLLRLNQPVWAIDGAAVRVEVVLQHFFALLDLRRDTVLQLVVSRDIANLVVAFDFDQPASDHA